MSTERTLVLLKPDAMQRGLVGAILGRIEQRGLKLVALKLLRLDEPLARAHYAAHVEQDFFPGLLRFMTGSPIVAAAFEGPNAVAAVRSTMGATDPLAAAAGTVRADFGLEVGRNLVHGSDSAAAGEREIALFFQPDEILSWERDSDRWIQE